MKDFKDLDPYVLYTVMKLSDHWFGAACPDWVEKIATRQCVKCNYRELCCVIDYYGSQAKQVFGR